MRHNTPESGPGRGVDRGRLDVPRRAAVLVTLVCCCNPLPLSGEDDLARRFDTSVAPILIQRCLECHSGLEPKGGFNLMTADSASAGGDSGTAIVAGQPNESLLWQRVRNDEMPPETPLPNREKEVIRHWIQSGGAWGSGALDLFRFTNNKRAGYDWWSLQPVRDQPPPVPPSVGWTRNGIDHFILRKLASHGLRPSLEAGRRTQIRRLSFDLRGLPPTPAEVEAFQADGEPGAYERLVDRFLASPHYGIRWGRHWLDVARFGESQGFERDKLRDNSWPYRDWVITALNADMPYDEFVRQQIAGDVLYPGTGESIVATGFLVAGPYDEVGQNQQSTAMTAVVRQDELEDIVSVVSQTFLGLTVNCARCHDHKFDPITQREYYQMTSALDGVRHGSREVDTAFNRKATNQISKKRAAIAQQIRMLDRELAQRATSEATGDGPTGQDSATTTPFPFARWSFATGLEDVIGQLHGTANGKVRLDNGCLVVDGDQSFAASAPLETALREKTLEAWVRLDDLDQQGGGVISIQTLNGQMFDAIVFGERERGRWTAGSNSFTRTKSFTGPIEMEADSEFVHLAIAYDADGTIAAYRNGQPYGKPYRSGKLATFPAGRTQVLFGLRHSPAGGNRLLRGGIKAAHLYDRALNAAEVAASYAAAAGRGVSLDRLTAVTTSADRERRARLQTEFAELTAALPASRTAYAVKPREPDVGYLLLRGNPAAQGEQVSAKGIEALVGLPAEFELSPDAPDSHRRRKLAQWITDSANPLFARVIANRLWHHHFGVGLVETPNDFGFNGGRPSHPDLIDYLAMVLIRHNWSLKSLHRMIVTSATYRQSSGYSPKGAAMDADNRWLWRQNPRRLEAEALRDAILSVTGELNQRMNGPGYRDFETFTHNTQFYEMKDPIGAAFNRRSVYRTWIRSGRNRLLDVFDCPDPSTKTPQRAVTVTPIQALALLNNSFVLRMSQHFAQRVCAAAGGNPVEQARLVYQLAYGRDPTEQELAESAAFIRGYHLAELCRVALNSNEFLYVD